MRRHMAPSSRSSTGKWPRLRRRSWPSWPSKCAARVAGIRVMIKMKQSRQQISQEGAITPEVVAATCARCGELKSSSLSTGRRSWRANNRTAGSDVNLSRLSWHRRQPRATFYAVGTRVNAGHYGARRAGPALIRNRSRPLARIML